MAGTVAGRQLATRRDVTLARGALRFPRPAVAAPPLPAGSDLHIPGLSSFITPNDSFYRVDTALLLPQVDPSTWQLRIHGMVQREVTITFAELLRRPLIEAYVTLTCVSDPVGGPYVGNAKWLGARLADLIRQARPRAGASQLLCTSVDGFTSGTPLQVVLDGRDALLAVAMNGTALPVEHGFPARMVIPGLYGYVSATKWVTDIEVTTFADATAYWATRGWSQQAPIKTESRIDVPAIGSTLRPGPTQVAGVAWAQHKGVAAVEVRVDRGPWHEARLAAVPDIDTWRQWVWEWPATPGRHLIEARATDKTGYTQTAVQAQPAAERRLRLPLRRRHRPRLLIRSHGTRCPAHSSACISFATVGPGAREDGGAMSTPMLSSPGWPGSTWTTGPNGTRMPPPGLVTTGSTHGCPTRRRRPGPTSAARLTAGPPGSPRSTAAPCRRSTRWTPR